MQQLSKTIHHSDGVGIHTVSVIQKGTQPTLVFLPGMSGAAEEGARFFAPCVAQGFNIISMSFRGRGRSSTPKEGYTLDDHADDIELVINDSKCSQVILIANSVSTLYAAQYLLRERPTVVKGMVIVDHPLRASKFKKGWSDDFAKVEVRGKSVLNTMRMMAMDRIELESKAVDFYAAYEALGVPTLVMTPHLSWVLLSKDDLVLFERQKRTKVVHFEKSDHFVRLCEPEKFLETVVGFARGVSLVAHSPQVNPYASLDVSE